MISEFALLYLPLALLVHMDNVYHTSKCHRHRYKVRLFQSLLRRAAKRSAETPGDGQVRLGVVRAERGGHADGTS